MALPEYPYKNFSIYLYFIPILLLSYLFESYFNFAEIYFIAIFFDKENRPSIL